MAGLLRKWLNDEVVLSSEVHDFEAAFRNGYLLGEILHRFNQQKSFSMFVNTQSADSKVRNFVLLEPTLRRLGIPLSPRAAFDIMSGKKGAALKVLFGVKIVIDKLKNLPRVGQRVVDGVEPLPIMSEKVSRPSFDKKSSELFEYTIRNLVENENNVLMERHVQKYTNRQTVLLQNAAEAQAAERTAELQRIEAIRHSAKEKLAARQMQTSAAHDTEVWRNNLNNRTLDLKRNADFAARTQRKATAKQALKKETLASATIDDLDRFDERLQALSPSAGPQQNGGDSDSLITLSTSTTAGKKKKKAGSSASWRPGGGGDDDDDDQQPAVEDYSAFEDRLAAQVAPTAVQRSEAGQFLSALTAKKSTVEAARAERERRRRLFLTTSLGARSAGVTDAVVSDTLARATRATEMEREIENDKRIVRAYKQVIVENRAFREKLYDARRELDSELEAAREEAAFEAHRNAHEMDMFCVMMQGLDRTKWEEAKQHGQNVEFCRSLLHGVLNVALEVAQARHLQFGAYRPKPTALYGLCVPPPVMQEILLEFHTEQARQQANKGAGPGSQDAPGAMDHLQRLSDAEYVNYLRSEGQWAEGSDAAVEGSGAVDAEIAAAAAAEEAEVDAEASSGRGDFQAATALAEIAQSVEAVANPPAPKPPLDAHVQFPLQVCLLGNRCAGKTRQARRIAARFSARVITFDDLVVAAATQDNAENAESAATYSVDPALAARVQANLFSGDDIQDELAVALVVDAVQRIDEDEYRGWVLDGWPSTLAQAQQLHQQLTGYSLDAEAAEAPEATGSRMCPPPLHVERPPPPALFDVVVRLDVDQENLLRRALGTRADLVRGGDDRFHLDDSLVPLAGPEVPLGPEGQGVVMRLGRPADLEPETDATADLGALERWRSAEVAWWYERFGNFSVACTDGLTEEEIFEQQVAPLCQAVLDTKAAADAAKAAEAAERRKVEAHEQLLRDFALIHGRFAGEREAAKTEEELAEIAKLEAAAAKGKKKKPAKLPPPRMETLELVITPEGVAILPLEGDALREAEAEAAAAGAAAADATEGDDDAKAAAAAEASAAVLRAAQPQVKLARFGRDVLVLPDKSKLSLAFAAAALDEEGGDVESKETSEESGNDNSQQRERPVATVTREADGLVFARVEEEVEEVEEPPPADPNAVASVAEAVQALPQPHAQLLAAEFRTIEQQFENALRASFEGLSVSRIDALSRLEETRATYVTFLQRPDAKQAIIDRAVDAFNSVPVDMRFDADVKAELHQQVSDLTKQLVEVVQERRAENEADLQAAKENGFLRSRLSALQAHLCALVQAEVDRSFGTRQFLADFYALRAFNVLGDDDEADSDGVVGAPNVLPAIEVDEEAAGSGGKKKPKAKPKKGAAAAADASSPAPQLAQCVSAAEVALEQMVSELLVPRLGKITSDAGMSAEDVAVAVESKVLAREVRATQRRVRRIRRVGFALCSELQTHAEGVYSSLASYGSERVAHEFAVVQTLASHLRGLVEAERQVEFRLEVEHVRPDDPSLVRTGLNGLVRLVENRARRLIAVPPPRPTRDVQSVDSRTCSRHQLVALARALASAASSTFPDALDRGGSPSLVPLATITEVIHRQIALGLLPAGWITDDSSANGGAWSAALAPFVLRPFDTPKGTDAARGSEVVDWRAVLASLWETSLAAENRGAELGPCRTDSQMHSRLTKLRTARDAIRTAAAAGESGTPPSGLIPAAALQRVAQDQLWFATGEVHQLGESPDERTAAGQAAASANARHSTCLDFLTTAFGMRSDSDRSAAGTERMFDLPSFLNYAAGIGAPSRSAAVTVAVGVALEKAVPLVESKHHHHHHHKIDVAGLFLGKEDVRVVFPAGRGYGLEAAALGQAMRSAGVVKLSTKEVIDATSKSQSHVIAVLHPPVEQEQTTAADGAAAADDDDDDAAGGTLQRDHEPDEAVARTEEQPVVE